MLINVNSEGWLTAAHTHTNIPKKENVPVPFKLKWKDENTDRKKDIWNI